MLGKTGLVFFHEFAEVAAGPAFFDEVQVHPGLVLSGLRPDFPVHRVRQEKRTRQLRIVGIAVVPLTQRLFGEVHLRNDARVRRIRAGAYRFVPERIVDPKIAHLQASEVFITRRRDLEHLQDVLAVFRNRRRRRLFGSRFRRRFRRRCRGDRAEDTCRERGCESGSSKACVSE